MSAIDEIKAKIDLVELVGASVKLTKAGRLYKGLSPFKQERTPSFFVDPERQYFKCYASGESGDIFGWVMKREGLNFREAMRELAQKAGIQLEERTPQQQHHDEQADRLRKAADEAAHYFHRLFLTAPQAAECRAYVKEKRGLTDETIATWMIGFSLNDYQALSNYLTQRGYTPQELVAAGLMIENDEGRRYDRFRGRLMIPIRDERGRAVGFGSRSLDGSEPKYMNSPATLIFEKSRTLFGLDRARAAIRNGVNGLTGSVLVEGYMDVIGVAQAGFANVVSSMGTSLTEDQFRALKKLHPRIVLALDPDAAGNRAILRGVDVAREALERDDVATFDARGVLRHESKLNADIRVAVMPDGKDPDELVLDAPDEWRRIIQNARPVVEHVIDTLLANYNLDDPRGKSEAVQAVAPIVKDLTDPVQRDFYIQKLSRALKLTERAVTQALGVVAAQPAATSPQRSSPKSAESPQKPSTLATSAGELGLNARAGESRVKTNLELHLLALLANKPELLIDANVTLTRAKLSVLGPEDFVNPAVRLGFTQLSREAMGGLPQVINTLSGDHEAVDDDWLSLIADQKITHEDDLQLREEAVRTALRLRESNLERELTSMRFLIDQATDSAKENGNSADLQVLNRQAQELASNRFRAQKALRLRNALVLDQS
ncbi:MAG: DNA primase [Anaerolineae bacterium]|nr:DNA primase [Anaerolineae bacterium]